MDQEEFQFIKKVFDFAKKHKMFDGVETVLIALSGGADSVSLMTLMAELGINISALYVDHGLRPTQTPSEIEFCSELCHKLKINLMVESVDVYQYQREHNIGISASARIKRYEALSDAAYKIGARHIALGHNKDDQCETFLINMLRGSGMSGLCGMPPIRDNTICAQSVVEPQSVVERLTLIRPLLSVNRSEIRSFLESRRINYITDPSNLTNKYLRNNIRSSLIPLLKKYNPSVMQTIYNTTEILSVEDRFLDSMVYRMMLEIVIKREDRVIELSLNKLSSIDLAILRRIIRQVLNHFNLTLGLIHIDSIIILIKNLNTGDRLTLPDGLIAIKDRDRLIIKNERLSIIPLIERNLIIPGDTNINNIGTLIRATCKSYDCPEPDGLPMKIYKDGLDEGLFDYDKINKGILKVRARKKGDFFYPQGFGRKKKLQDFFVDEKIPRDERDSIPIISLGDDIVWIAGLRADQRFVVSDDTAKILRLKIIR